jgi:hypothetical protein
MSRKTTVVLGGLLVVSLLGNVWLGMSAFSGLREFYPNMYRRYEITELRRFGERVAAGEAPRAGLVDSVGTVSEDHGWLDNGTLLAKFDGERLVKLCGSKTRQADSCAEDVK